MEEHPEGEQTDPPAGPPRDADSDPAGPAARPGPSLVRAALIFYAVLLGAAVLWAALSGVSLLYASAEEEVRGVRALRDVGAGALAGAIVILLSAEVTRRTRWGEDLARMLGSLLGPLSTGECLLLALASGIAEEAFFRGALQPHVGWFAASVLFGLAHFAPRRELLPWTAFSLLAGFLLGGLFEATGNLIAPIVTHVLVNAVNLRLLSLRYGGRKEDA